MLKLSQLQKDPEAFAGHVSVAGWVRTAREGKTMGFIELTDGTCFRPVQVVCPPAVRSRSRASSF